MSARLGAVHALPASMEPTQAAFDRHWPEADVAHLLDGSLYLDRSRGTADEVEIAARIDRLIRHSAASGAEGILFTGSFFGDAVRGARAHVQVPVLTSFEGIIERAIGIGGRLAVLSTAPDSTRLLTAEIEAAAAARGVALALESVVIAEALDALVAGEAGRHDKLVLEAIVERARAPDAGAIVMAQFSMERVLEAASSAAGVPVLGPATEGVAHLRRLIEAS